MKKRRAGRKPPPHRFGHFPNAKRVRVRGWYLPANRDDDVIWIGRFGESDRGQRRKR